MESRQQRPISGGSSNGRTAGFEPANWGSSPCPPTNFLWGCRRGIRLKWLPTTSSPVDQLITDCSAVVACLFWKEKVAGSNPASLILRENMKRLSNKKYALEPALRVFTIIIYYGFVALATWTFLVYVTG